MQNQNIPPIPNDDEWPLATVFDVTANQYFITIMTTSPPNIYLNMDECPQTKISQQVHNFTARPQHSSDGINTHCTHQNDNYMQCISL